MVKAGLWALLVLCTISFTLSCYNLVWKERGHGWRSFDLLALLIAIYVGARVSAWLF